MRKILFIILLFCQLGCDYIVTPKSSVIIIAVEGLGFDRINCEKELFVESKSGFDSLCKESIRFSHAFSVSPMSQPSVASILTGRSPRSHGVLDNGKNFLSRSHKTIAEVAIDKGYRTSFFSGGPPILRKSGFDQGFELFEDNINILLNQPYRPVKKTIGLLKNWISGLSNSQVFFSFVYLPDLQFNTFTTKDDKGALRKRSIGSQVTEIDESINELFVFLRNKNLWSSTNIFLVGLNNIYELNQRDNESLGSNLFQERTHVSLVVKPHRKKRDGQLNWQIDKNISLTDVGETIFEIMGVTNPNKLKHVDKDFRSRSFKSSLYSPESDIYSERPILLESFWPSWKYSLPQKMSIRFGHSLYTFDNGDISLYNTLTDRNENYPESIDNLPEGGVFDQISLKNYLPSHVLPYKTNHIRELYLIKKILSKDSIESLEDIMDEAINFQYTDLISLLARRALEDDNWDMLLKLSKYEGPYSKTWELVGNMNLENTVEGNEDLDACLKLFADKNLFKSNYKSCEDPLLSELLNWLNPNYAQKKRDSHREKFLKAYGNFEISRRIYEINLINGEMWDLSKATLLSPSLSELFLSLKDYKQFLKLIDKRVYRKDETKQ